MKHCPFCGGKPKTTESVTYYDDDEHNLYIIGCEECDYSLSDTDYPEKVVERWNRRVYYSADEDPRDTVEIRVCGESFIMELG